jgi:phosphatidylinositol transfer protein SFH5
MGINLTGYHRNLNVTEAHTMMVQTLRWRDEFNVEAAVKENFPEDVFGQLGRVYGHDKEGRPVT